MKKILALILVFFLCTSSVYAKKKEKAPAVPEGSGYVGTLPDLSESFQKSKPKEAEPLFEYQDGFNDQDSIKPAPRNNAAFVNIIMKKDKSSRYLNDLNEIIPIIEKLEITIEKKGNVQKFNAVSYYLKENVEYFRDKYSNTAEASYTSYNELMELNMQVQSVAQLRLESEAYSPYVTAAQSGNMFTQNNIDNQLDYLLEKIKTTLVVLKQAE